MTNTSNKKPLISVIIVSYNTCKLTTQCIQSIYDKTTSISYEIIVVDNASSDSSIKVLKKDFPNVILIESTENLGFGRANNLGAKHSSGQYLFFLNPDTILISNAIKILYDYMSAHKNVKICGGALYDANSKPNISYGNFPSLIQELAEVGLHKLFYKYYKVKLAVGVVNTSDVPFEVCYVSGANMMVSTDLFIRLNGFDPDFFLYYEETELAFRAKKIGFKSMLIPTAKIIHLESASTKVIGNDFKFKQLAISKKLFFLKCYGRISVLLLKLVSCAKLLIHFYKYKKKLLSYLKLVIIS